MRQISAGLRRVVDGAAVKEAQAFTGELMGDRAVGDFSGHSRSGNTERVMLIRTEGRRVWLDFPYYLRFHPWWDTFHKGMPADIAKAAGDKYREVIRRLLHGQ